MVPERYALFTEMIDRCMMCRAPLPEPDFATLQQDQCGDWWVTRVCDRCGNDKEWDIAVFCRAASRSACLPGSHLHPYHFRNAKDAEVKPVAIEIPSTEPWLAAF